MHPAMTFQWIDCLICPHPPRGVAPRVVEREKNSKGALQMIARINAVKLLGLTLARLKKY
jgi:hypothetical protein